MKRPQFAFQALVVFVAAVSGATRVWAADAVLDRIVAGSEANIAKIQSGHAVYSITRIQYLDGVEQSPKTDELDVSFDYPRVRIDSKTRQLRKIYLKDGVISFDATNLPVVSRIGPRNLIATIKSLKEEEPIAIHPRMLGPAKWTSLAGEIRALESNPDCQVEGSEASDGGLLIVRTHSEKMKVRALYEVAPQFGYGVVRATEWLLRDGGEEPFFEMTARYRKADNGALVLDRRTTSTAFVRDGKLLPQGRQEVELKEMTLIEPPSEKLLRLDGLGLPGGAMIQDRINGKEYLYDPKEAPERSGGVGK
jgi:hypothetical protein